MRLALPLILSLVALAPAVASARPFSPRPDDKPWTRGTLMPSFGLGGSFGRNGGGTLLVGGGLTYFAINNLGFGLHLRNFTTFLPSYLKTANPGIEKQIPTNEFSLTPGVMLVLYRNYRFSPYIHAGAGPVFFNHGRGVVGEWVAGPGFLIGLGRRLAINIGVSFSSRFPSEKCKEAYRYEGQDVYANPCGFRFGINFGLVFGIGVGRQRREPDDEYQYQPPPPPSSPPPPQNTYPAPAPPPSYTPAEPPAEAPPAEPPPSDPPDYAPPPTTPQPAPATPPATTPPPATPPGESMPVAPPP